MRLRDFLEYLVNKSFVREYEKDSGNYDGKYLILTSKYVNASVDVTIWKMIKGMKGLVKIIKESIKKTA